MAPTSTAPVLVTGATGRVGSLVAERLLGAGLPVRALTRRAEAVHGLPDGVEVVVGDLTEPDSLGPALDGVAGVFLVWTAPPTTVEAVLERVAAHARRVVFLSSPHRTPHPFFQQANPMAALHAEIERLLVASGLETAMVRPGMFASNAVAWWAPAIRADGVVRWPYGDVQTAPVDERDVAAVAAHCLTVAVPPTGDLVLTGPEAMTQAEQAQVIGEVLGRPVRFEELTPEEFRAATEGTWPRPVVDMLLAAWGAAVGTPAYVTTTVRDVLGVPARTFRESVADQAW